MNQTLTPMTKHITGNEIVALMGLTRSEWDALYDRLTLGDCLAQVFEERHDMTAVEAAADLLSDGRYLLALERHGLEIVRDIIVDCVEGSTWVAVCSYIDDPAKQRRTENRRSDVLRALARKIAAHYGLKRIDLSSAI